MIRGENSYVWPEQTIRSTRDFAASERGVSPRSLFGIGFLSSFLCKIRIRAVRKNIPVKDPAELLSTMQTVSVIGVTCRSAGFRKGGGLRRHCPGVGTGLFAFRIIKIFRHRPAVCFTAILCLGKDFPIHKITKNIQDDAAWPRNNPIDRNLTRIGKIVRHLLPCMFFSRGSFRFCLRPKPSLGNANARKGKTECFSLPKKKWGCRIFQKNSSRVSSCKKSNERGGRNPSMCREKYVIRMCHRLRYSRSEAKLGERFGSPSAKNATACIGVR